MSDKYNGIWLSPIEVKLLGLIHVDPRITDERLMKQLNVSSKDLRSIIFSVERVFETERTHAALLAKQVGII
jgi:hypothetical protein